ncbi:serum amyloid P-component-like [Petaurus breviceps papuanus]|uniref:serum amyloid P-component-like n=1 Tax=Petaurus breviceps papuanus TaxID=3040969 RepID=UPI0036DF3B25
MKIILSGALVLYSLLGAIAQTDMKSKVFVFPRESSDAHVLLIPQLEKPLQNLSVCLRAFTDLNRSFALFSYATRANDNELLLLRAKAGEYHLHIGNEKISFGVNEDLSFPVHICASWESASGIAELWINDRAQARKGLKKGYSVGAQAKIVLGQDQDSFGGSFDNHQSFVGEIGEVHMWDFVLSPDQVHSLYNGETLSGNILNWGALNYEIKGYVVPKPQLWS